MVYQVGHVGIATGNVRVDENGNVVEFEMIHSSGSKGVVKEFMKASSKYTFAHPFRTSDEIQGEFSQRRWKKNVEKNQTQIELN